MSTAVATFTSCAAPSAPCCPCGRGSSGFASSAGFLPRAFASAATSSGSAFGFAVLRAGRSISGFGLIGAVSDTRFEQQALLAIRLLADGDADDATLLQLAEEDFLGERLLDVFLDDARERACTHLLVVTLSASQAMASGARSKVTLRSASCDSSCMTNFCTT